MSEIVFRKMWGNDLKRQGLQETIEALSRMGEFTPELLASAFRKRLAQNIVSYIGLDGEAIVAIGSLLVEQKLIHSCGCIGHIEDVAIKKDYQRQGLGQKLIACLVEEAKKQGCYKIILDCLDSRIEFYKKCGFYHNCNQMRMDL